MNEQKTELDSKLEKAICAKDKELIKSLVKEGAEFNKLDCPVGIAVSTKDLSIVELVMKLGADLNMRTYKRGYTAIHQALVTNNLAALELLLEYGANPDITEDYGFSPLHFACQDMKEEAIQLLVKYGAKTNIGNFNEETPFDLFKNSLNEKQIKSDELIKRYEKMLTQNQIRQANPVLKLTNFVHDELNALNRF